jgi:hypothetical protein
MAKGHESGSSAMVSYFEKYLDARKKVRGEDKNKFLKKIFINSYIENKPHSR